jgi:hypothetical protein
MGILRGGVFGPVQGRTGPLVGRVVRKQNVVSALPHKSALPGSTAVSVQQLKFAAVSSLINQLLPLISLGFAYDLKRGALRAAMRHNFRQILSVDNGAVFIDYPKLVLGRGRVAGLNAPSVRLADSGAVVFRWTADVQQEYCRDLDRVCVLIYNASKREPLITTEEALRHDLLCAVDLPADFADDDLYAYILMVSWNGKWASDSMYLGKIEFND